MDQGRLSEDGTVIKVREYLDQGRLSEDGRVSGAVITELKL